MVSAKCFFVLFVFYDVSDDNVVHDLIRFHNIGGDPAVDAQRLDRHVSHLPVCIQRGRLCWRLPIIPSPWSPGFDTCCRTLVIYCWHSVPLFFPCPPVTVQLGGVVVLAVLKEVW